jgi:hypothetical protein
MIGQRCARSTAVRLSNRPLVRTCGSNDRSRYGVTLLHTNSTLLEAHDLRTAPVGNGSAPKVVVFRTVLENFHVSLVLVFNNSDPESIKMLCLEPTQPEQNGKSE